MKNFNYKKSQAAMEFLMTYGWAILVVLAAIAALAYFGVLSPEKFLPEQCILAPGIACVQHKVDPTTTTLIISNGFGRTIKVTNIQVGACNTNFDTSMLTGDEAKFILTGCSNGISKAAFKGDVTLTYMDTAYNITKIVQGKLVTKVE
ncbi:hypothetical protein HYX01_04880 [Candidatus Woesearchaeota archaeon]|nr:hypothetical protein [Candidatus Woesearchaeota archaeon]